MVLTHLSYALWSVDFFCVKVEHFFCFLFGDMVKLS